MQNTAQLDCLPIRLTKIKKTNPPKYRQIYGGSGMFIRCREECKLLQPFQKL